MKEIIKYYFIALLLKIHDWWVKPEVDNEEFIEILQEHREQLKQRQNYYWSPLHVQPKEYPGAKNYFEDPIDGDCDFVDDMNDRIANLEMEKKKD